MRRITVFIKFVFLSVSMVATFASAQTFRLNSDGYFNAGGTDVMAFSDFYPEGHQGDARSVAARAETAEPPRRGRQDYHHALLSRLLAPHDGLQSDGLS